MILHGPTIKLSNVYRLYQMVPRAALRLIKVRIIQAPDVSWNLFKCQINFLFVIHQIILQVIYFGMYLINRISYMLQIYLGSLRCRHFCRVSHWRLQACRVRAWEFAVIALLLSFDVSLVLKLSRPVVCTQHLSKCILINLFHTHMIASNWQVMLKLC